MFQTILHLSGFLTRAPVALAIFQNLHTQPSGCSLCKMCLIDWPILYCITICNCNYLAHTRPLPQRRVSKTTLSQYRIPLLSFLPTLDPSVPALCWHLLGTNLIALVPQPRSQSTAYVFLVTTVNVGACVHLPVICLQTPIHEELDQAFNMLWPFPSMSTCHL